MPRPQSSSLVVLLMCLIFATGCTSLTNPDEPDPTPTPKLDTVAAAGIGERLVVTASVADVLAGHAFVVQDVDLADQGLLVLGRAPADLAPTDLVTVGGTVELFTIAHFGPRYHLTDPARYQRFDGHKALVADQVRSWA
jgi:hypothetical protein